ncbi:hypothetical protein RND71_042722 [Anisodus tanguticus]|uniref:Uncharacterized protein n=1 Tax=Anisodus tanguticus TaxID=243964 RepID=A0AAE1QRG1_9SOLA|nr:hypothetical protein RND71_042722 [Anisodus tanguticus]
MKMVSKIHSSRREFLFLSLALGIRDLELTFEFLSWEAFDAVLDPAGLVAVAVAHAFALFVGVSMAANISGGHLNSAVTFGSAVGGNITILTGFFYTIAQCLCSTAACLLLKFVTNGLAVPTHGVAAGLIGFIVGANILAAGPFSGGSMNPARSFGPAVVAGDFLQNWIYWVGPLIGGGLAGLIYGDVCIGSHDPLPVTEDYA